MKLLKQLFWAHSLSILALTAVCFLSGLAQSFFLLKSQLLVFESIDDFWLQCLLGTMDFLLPVLFLLFGVSLLPADVDSGFVRQLISLPASRMDLLIRYAVLYFVSCALFTEVYFAGLSLPVLMKMAEALSPSWPEAWKWPIILPLACTVPLISYLLLSWLYFVVRHRILSFVVTFFILFLFELAAAFLNAYTYLPTTHFGFFAEWIADMQTGHLEDYQSMFSALSLNVLWAAVLFYLNAGTFRRKNLLYEAF